MTTILGPQKLGPLTPLVGEWEGDAGVDFSFHNKDGGTAETSYFEKAWFKPIPIQENGQQTIEGLKYEMTAWRHGEEAMDPFHDEVGYLLWEKKTGVVMRTVVFGRGIAIQAGGHAEPRDTTIEFTATPGEPNYGILQNEYLSERAELISFRGSFTFHDDESFGYDQTLVLKLATMDGKQMNHTDRNTLHRVKRFHPGAQHA
ncbi:MAG TPA: heme-binding beta-barrel domain-containing protein [Mycolicibacillus parakoreensis]|nr:heme-binding beta-barrel domain-containing protein [Mycolicibacillus parakoreensis]